MRTGCYESDTKEKSKTRACAWEGCEEEGLYPAPKSPKELNIRQHYCLNHVRQYNRSWNYFEGMSDHEGVQYQEESVTGHRPTWKMGVQGKLRNPSADRLLHALYETFGDGRFRAEDSVELQRPSIPAEEREALEVLALTYPVTIKEIKQRYKELAKQYHPDTGNKAYVEQFKAVTHAYHVLKTSEYI